METAQAKLSGTPHTTTQYSSAIPSQIIFQELVFPLLCYSDKDDELWHDDPYEFIRLKYGKKCALGLYCLLTKIYNAAY